MFYKKGALKNFAKFTESQSATTFLKKRLWHRCFPVNFAIFLRTLFLQNTSARLLLSSINWIFLWRSPIQNHSKASITEKRGNEAKYLSRNSITLKFVKKISNPNHVETLGYINCFNLSSPRPIKSPSNSIRLSKDLQLIEQTEIREKVLFFEVINKPIIYKFFKYFNNHRQIGWAVVEPVQNQSSSTTEWY